MLQPRQAGQRTWLVDLEKQAVEVYNLHDASLKLVGVFTGGDQLTTPALPGFSSDASEVFIVPPLFNP